MANTTTPDYESFYNSLRIGDRVQLMHSNKMQRGVLMDKYLAPGSNVFGDFLLDGGTVLEHVPFFAGDYAVIQVL